GVDFTAIEDIQLVKRKIDAAQQHRGQVETGHNVKLGAGGIRQIEFFAQAHQLLFSSQFPGLKIKQTRTVLSELVAHRKLDPADQRALDEAYIWLRVIEHRLQMRDDQQTHTMPTDEAGMTALAVSVNMDVSTLMATHEGHRATVRRLYDQLFDRPSGSNATTITGTPDQATSLAQQLTIFGFADPAKAAGLIENWQAGQYPATASNRGRDLLAHILPDLLHAFGTMADPDAVLLRFDGFLASLNAGVPVFALIKNSERLPQLFAQILGSAPALADLVTRRPRLLEAVLDLAQTDRLPSWHHLENELQEQLGVARDYEECLDICRRWTARHRFKAALHLLNGQIGSDHIGQYLARLAEICLVALQPIVEDDFARQHGRFPGGGMAIIAMGNLASGHITLTSDLDLVLVYRVDALNKQSDGKRPLSPNEYWIKLAARLVAAITSPTAEGRLYDVDLRLRPQGDSGPLAVSLESFGQYQHSDAWTWEHMALTRARTITGDIDIKARIEALVFKTLTAPRDSTTLLHDVADMRRRMAAQHKATTIWQLKHVPGGLVDIQFMAQYLMLRHAHDVPHIISASSGAALERCAQAGLLDRSVANDLIDAHRLYRRVRSYLRLIAVDGVPFDPDAISASIRQQLAQVILGDVSLGQETANQPIDFDQATAHLNGVIAQTHGHYINLIQDPAASL
ncbi:MAG: glutamine-synthetase adenylyltransferase, partial [Pseudomonadota bacterium]